jgi:peptide/nickel transport system substrate-binding protein
VLFHDGQEMTAEDVVFTFERIISENGISHPEPHTSPRKSLAAPLESVEQIGEYSVLMHLAGPWPPALQMLVHQQIVPKHYVERVGDRVFAAQPVGTGPFRFVSASDDLDVIALERFDDYYGGAPDLAPVGPACVGRVIFRVIPDPRTRAAGLRAGEVHIMQSVPLELVDVLVGSRDVAVLSAPGTRPTWMELNVTRPPFDDQRVRQALNHAVNTSDIAQEVYAGQALVVAGPLSPLNAYASEALQAYPWDPDRALALLDEAGWSDTNQDGTLDRDGEPFFIVLDTLDIWSPLAEAVANDLRAIGIRVTVRYWERSEIRPLLLEGHRTAYLDGWGDSAFDPVGHFEAKWHTYVEGGLYGRANYSGYSSERVDELIRLGELTADEEQRQRIYDEAQTIIYGDAPAVFLILPREVAAASERVSGWEPASDGRINLHDVCLAP